MNGSCLWAAWTIRPIEEIRRAQCLWRAETIKQIWLGVKYSREIGFLTAGLGYNRAKRCGRCVCFERFYLSRLAFKIISFDNDIDNVEDYDFIDKVKKITSISTDMLLHHNQQYRLFENVKVTVTLAIIDANGYELSLIAMISMVVMSSIISILSLVTILLAIIDSINSM